MLPKTSTKVSDHTPDHVNQAIMEETRNNIKKYSKNGKDTIEKRLKELDREWDIERVLETNVALIGLIGLGSGVLVNEMFYLLSALVSFFLLQHALQGWCLPVSFFRRRGIRTMKEIHGEKFALKSLRGDFETVCGREGYKLADPDSAFEIMME